MKKRSFDALKAGDGIVDSLEQKFAVRVVSSNVGRQVVPGSKVLLLQNVSTGSYMKVGWGVSPDPGVYGEHGVWIVAINHKNARILKKEYPVEPQVKVIRPDAVTGFTSALAM